MEIKTLGDAWRVLKEHGLESKYCPHCDQFSQARVLLKQDEKISDLYEAVKLMVGDNPAEVEVGVIKGREALAKAEGKSG